MRRGRIVLRIAMVNTMDNDPGYGGASNDSELDTTPHSWEAEQALLGALLYDNEIYHRVSGIVQPKHFYNPVNARIYEQTCLLYTSPSPRD